MGESNLNNQEGKNTPAKNSIPPANLKSKPYVYKRKQRKPSFHPFYFLATLLFLMGVGVYVLYPSPDWKILYPSPDKASNLNMENIVPMATPIPIEVQDDIIIEFSDQTILFNCKSFDYHDDYELVKWNETIKIIKYETEFDYINRQGGGLLIIPEFHVFFDNPQMSLQYRDDRRCYTDNKFVYNLTIAGKTITNSYYLNMDDCYQTNDCNIMGHFNEVMS